MFQGVISLFNQAVVIGVGLVFAGVAWARPDWNVTHEIPPGVYEGTPEFANLFGGTIQGGMVDITGASPVQGTIGTGSDISGLNLIVTNATLSAKGCRFTNCSFYAGKGGKVELDSCVLYACSFSDMGPNRRTASTEPAEKFSVTMRNCVVFGLDPDNPARRDIMLTVANPSTFVFQVENCTFAGWDTVAMLGNNDRDGFIKLAKDAGSYVRSCVFNECGIPTYLLPVTDRCRFEDMRITAGDDTQSQHIVTAWIRPMEVLSRLRKNYRNLHIIAPEADFGAGSTIENDGKSKASLSVSKGAVAPFASVVPPYSTTPVASTQMPAAAAATPTPGAMGITGSSGAPDTGLKLQQASVHGLMILSLDRGEAGSASKMSAIALDTDKSEAALVSFNQEVGEMMSTALAEVGKFTQLRNKGWPKGYRIELSFADKYSGKDGPSAAVACALLLNSLITGKENDPEFAVTGDMNADGSVQPIGGVAAKIRGATSGKCKLVAIPNKNVGSLADVLLTDGPAPFAGIQIYSISSFDEAEALALKDKPAATQNAINEMARVQEVLLKNQAQMAGWLRNQHVIAKLQSILQAAPNNVSAKYLLMYATGKVPMALSLAGSLDSVDNAASDLIAAIKSNKGQNASGLRKDVVGSSITKLQTLRAKCDPRLRPYIDSVVRFGSAVKEAQDRPANSSARANVLITSINSAANAADAEMARLMSDPQVVEELEK